MIPGLKKVDSLAPDEIDESVFFRDPTRPSPREKVLQWFRLPDPDKRLSQNGLDQVQNPQGRPSVGFHPETQIFSKLRLKNGLAWPRGPCVGLTTLGQGRTPVGGPQPFPRAISDRGPERVR